MSVIRTRKTSHGTYTIEEVSGGYAIYRNGELYKSTYSKLEDAVYDLDHLPN